MTVVEGNSVIISCSSTGAPTPTITWHLDDQLAPFTSSESVTEPQITLVRRDADSFTPDVVNGDIISNLYIVDAQYPNHDGIYTCIGSNDNQIINT